MGQNSFSKMMLGIAIGDAFGAGYEFLFKERKYLQHLKLEGYTSHPNPDFKHVAGRYTDDTQMSIAVAEALVTGSEITKEFLTESFVRVYKRDRAVGYAKGFQAFLDSINSSEEFLEKIRPDSKRNGAAMRAVPIGVLPTILEVVKLAITNAKITHDTPQGIASSIVVALISHYNLYHKRMPNLEKEVIPYIQDICLETTNYLWEIWGMKDLDAKFIFGKKHEFRGVPCDGMRTAGAVWYILSNYKRPACVLLESVKLGGDTDSVASIALGINMMHNKLIDLPTFLYDDLTNHRYGRTFLTQLGDLLSERYAKR